MSSGEMFIGFNQTNNTGGGAPSAGGEQRVTAEETTSFTLDEEGGVSAQNSWTEVPLGISTQDVLSIFDEADTGFGIDAADDGRLGGDELHAYTSTLSEQVDTLKNDPSADPTELNALETKLKAAEFLSEKENFEAIAVQDGDIFQKKYNGISRIPTISQFDVQTAAAYDGNAENLTAADVKDASINKPVGIGPDAAVPDFKVKVSSLNRLLIDADVYEFKPGAGIVGSVVPKGTPDEQKAALTARIEELKSNPLTAGAEGTRVLEVVLGHFDSIAALNTDAIDNEPGSLTYKDIKALGALKGNNKNVTDGDIRRLRELQPALVEEEDISEAPGADPGVAPVDPSAGEPPEVNGDFSIKRKTVLKNLIKAGVLDILGRPQGTPEEQKDALQGLVDKINGFGPAFSELADTYNAFLEHFDAIAALNSGNGGDTDATMSADDVYDLARLVGKNKKITDGDLRALYE